MNAAVKTPLQIKPLPLWRPRGIYALKSALPFVENQRAVLIHRPRYAAMHEALGPQWFAHLSVEMWCGAIHQSGTMKSGGPSKLTFLPDIPPDKFLCAVCEARAVEQGKLQPAHILVGRHVCVGGVRAYNKCAAHGEPNDE